jgi:fumarate hydratase class I
MTYASFAYRGTAPASPWRLPCRVRRTGRLARITSEGVFLEHLERDPARYLPDVTEEHLEEDVVHIDLNRSMDQIRHELSQLPVKTRLSLSGPMVVARDIAHARIKDNLDAGRPMPAYFRDHVVYYAGPAKTPEGYASGSFGPTTAGRMDSYVDQFQKAGGSFVMLAKGNRSDKVTQACKDNGGFYLGSIGGPAARLAQDVIKNVEVLEFADLGMEAVWRIDVVDFPAFVVVDNKGNDFFAETSRPTPTFTQIPVGRIEASTLPARRGGNLESGG